MVHQQWEINQREKRSTTQSKEGRRTYDWQTKVDLNTKLPPLGTGSCAHEKQHVDFYTEQLSQLRQHLSIRITRYRQIQSTYDRLKRERRRRGVIEDRQKKKIESSRIIVERFKQMKSTIENQEMPVCSVVRARKNRWNCSSATAHTRWNCAVANCWSSHHKARWSSSAKTSHRCRRETRSDNLRTHPARPQFLPLARLVSCNSCLL